MSMRRTLFALLVSLLALAPLAAALAQGRPLDAPRAAGQVAERFDGFAVVRDAGAPAPIKALVDQTNAERHTLYQQRATADGATPDAVGKIYAQEIMKAAPAGTWFQQESGQWVKK
jgi:uncharacterized protein YdbL (DUF1318 family)